MAEEDTKEDYTIAVELSNGTTAVLPLIGMRPAGNHVGRRLRSTYAGNYGGVIADGPLTPEISELYQEACNWRTAECKIVQSPLIDKESRLSAINSFFPTVELDFTQILSLAKDVEEVIGNFSKDRRYGIRKSKEKGVVVRETTNKGEYRDYFHAYEESLERWENISIRYSWDTFEKIYELSCDFPDRVKLWVTDVDGSVASGAVVFYWNKHVAYWHAASYSQYFDYYVNDRIQADIIRDAIDRGCNYYDFLPSGGNEGVVRFKEQFGPKRRKIRRWTYETNSFKAIRRSKDIVPFGG